MKTTFTVEWDGDSTHVDAYDERDAAEKYCSKQFWAKSPDFPRSFEGVVVKQAGNTTVFDVEVREVPEFIASRKS